MDILKIVIILVCILGTIYMFTMNKKYQNDTSSSKEDIINYFKAHNITSLETGIKVKDLPLEISKNPYLLMMVKDKTLKFQKGKYYLNQEK